MGWLTTNGLTRSASLQKTASEAMPLMGAAMVMFFLAALIEGFLSPSAAPASVKWAAGAATVVGMAWYFGRAGGERRGRRGSAAHPA
jgi:uncharacterized membrane protein SpoIIM required for sporulation